MITEKDIKKKGVLIGIHACPGEEGVETQVCRSVDREGIHGFRRRPIGEFNSNVSWDGLVGIIGSIDGDNRVVVES